MLWLWTPPTEHSTVQNTQRSLDLDGEVDVARSVDDVYLVALPVDAGGCAGYGYSSLALKLHAVHGCSDAVLSVDFVDCVNPVAVVEDSLAEGGFSGIDMCADSNVSHL